MDIFDLIEMLDFMICLINDNLQLIVLSESTEMVNNLVHNCRTYKSYKCKSEFNI